jgi:Coenzyme PQQ synthesis protein D (PqqD)
MGELIAANEERVGPARQGVSAGLFFLGSTELESSFQGHAASGDGGLGVDLLGLARALSTNPAWREMPGATLVVRPEPRPALGVVGCFDAAAEERLARLGPQLADALAHLRYVSYSRAEEDCELLATRLVERFGREKLRRFCFVAIPRGGFIVLGMLAYALGLEHTQLEPPYPPGAPLVVVDDCALSGYRFGRFVSRWESREVVFAHLYSHPDLRSAIEAREPRVMGCIAAHDLHDRAPALHGERYAAWRERQQAKYGDDAGYWGGLPDHLCFPWNEADVTFWNPVTERFERGWCIVPPEFCLKNRPGPGMEPIPVQVQPEGPGPLRPSARVLFGEHGGNIVVGNMETKASFSLTGVAADMWRAVVERGSVEAAAAALSGEYEVGEGTLRADLRDFVEDLRARDLLERSDDTTLHR